VSKKVLFLDIDGVCNSAKFAAVTKNRGVLGIDPYAAFLVGKIQLDTGCDVVLSSTWRLLKESREDVRRQVVDFVGVTPDLRGKDRGYEIEAFLDNHEEYTRYAILDDDMDMLAYQAPNFFRTTWQEGLTPEIAKAVTEHLNA